MRVSTSMIFSQGTEAIERQQAEMLHNQQQIGAGRRILTAADDPVAAAEALTVTQAKEATAQYSTNVDTAKAALGLNDSVLGQVSNVVQSIRVLAVNGGNAALNDSDRASLATDIAGQLEQLIGLANTRDGNGDYLFSGYQIDTQSFVSTPSG